MTNVLRPQVASVPLSRLFGVGVDDALVSGVTINSRDVRPGCLYVGLPGSRTHGASFAQTAAAAGAAAILTDRQGESMVGEVGVPVVVVDDVRQVLGPISAEVFDHPSRKLKTLGITGTNGKTTTAFLTAAALPDQAVATVGTIGYRLRGEVIEAPHSTVTTPEAPDLQALLALLVQRGAEVAALEVSSHALSLRRVDGIEFAATAFVNLGRDHLDFHHNMDEYFAAKSRLFTPEFSPTAVVNIGDEAGRRIEKLARSQGIDVVTVGPPSADYHLSDFRQVSALHSASLLHTPQGRFDLELAMPGEYNALDAAIAFALAQLVGGTPERAIAGLADAHVPGRMQPVDLGEEAPLVVVDFAHTPQAVASALNTLAAGPGRVLVVLGAGGDRDRAKRAPMGEAAAAGADVVIVTDDNPRFEPPESIRAQVLAGAPGGIEVPGRAAAIRTALELATPADVVAILGKGHERGQTIAGEVVEFDDVMVAREQWNQLRRKK